MHIALLVANLGVGGLEWNTVRLARELSRRHQVIVFCVDWAGPLARELTAAGINFEVLGRRPGLDLRCVRRLARRLRELRVDVLHAQNHTGLFFGRLAAFLARRVAFVWTKHSSNPPCGLRHRLVDAVLANTSHAVTVVSADLADFVVRVEWVRRSIVRVVPNGVDAAPAARDMAAVREELGLGPSDIGVGVVAGLKPQKDHGLLIEAMAVVVTARPDIVALCIGDGELRPMLERRVEERGLTTNVRFLGQRDDVGGLYGALDIVVLPTRTEGMPLSILEAMAASRPVVACRAGGVSEVVVDGVTGLLVAPGARDALVDAIMTLASDPARRAAMGAAGRERQRERHTTRRMAEAYEAVYDEALRRRRGSGAVSPPGPTSLC